MLWIVYSSFSACGGNMKGPCIVLGRRGGRHSGESWEIVQLCQYQHLSELIRIRRRGRIEL